MAILELRDVAPDDPLHFTCFLCQFVAADRAQLKKHLTTLHQFPCHDWTPARDSLEDQMTCAHCGSVHHCQQALRKHIIYGHCSQFDPARPWTRNGDADIVEKLTSGRIDLILADVDMRSRLTHDCQFCSQKFSQVSNLVSHLWQQHSELADEGELYRQVLQQRFAPRGCSCVPRIKQFRSTHTCVLFHQLSMIHFNGNALFNIPVVYDDAARERMETHVPLRLLLLMHDALKTRDFELLQQDSKFRELLRQQCLCCGKPVTLTGPANEHVLRHYLQTAHQEPQQAIQCLIQMVIHRKGHDHLTTCDWCGVTIVPTTPHNEYDEHLAECPVLLYFVTWLLIPLTSSTHGSRAGGHGITDPGCAGTAGGLRGSKRLLSEEPKKESAVGSTVFSRQRRRGSSQDADPNVSIGVETRAGSELPSSAKHLHPVHVDGEGRPDVPDLAAKQQLETVATATPGDPISSTMPGALYVMQTLVQRVTKAMECKKEDPLWQSSLQSKLVLQDASWPFLKWDHQKQSLEVDAKVSSLPMKDLMQTLEQIYKLLERPEAIVRFHALQNKSKQVPVIPWRLELDMKDHKLHNLMHSLVNCSAWQLVQIRLKPHHQQQSKLADDLMKLSKKK